MVTYRKYVLGNGLTLVTHEATDTPLATVNMLYNVGSRDENPTRTGFAHLFEHLMFGGTPQVPDFDTVVSSCGGECNAFTNTDITNYYITLPAAHLDTALQLEADRMANLTIDAHSLDVQQHVVTEEYHQRYTNQPYGDVWLLLRRLTYDRHPYRWATIGDDINHVAQATLDDVRAFHERFYRPQNAILAIAAPLQHEQMAKMAAEAWQCSVQPCNDCGAAGERVLALQSASCLETQVFRYGQVMQVERDVPASRVYITLPMVDHFDPLFRACDLLTDVLANGQSSRLYDRLVRNRQVFTSVDASISGEAGPGMIVVGGTLAGGINHDDALEALRHELLLLVNEPIADYELAKVINKYENTYVYAQYKAADRALGLCMHTWLGDTETFNTDPEQYRCVTAKQMYEAAQMLRPERGNVLIYRSAERQ